MRHSMITGAFVLYLLILNILTEGAGVAVND